MLHQLSTCLKITIYTLTISKQIRSCVNTERRKKAFEYFLNAKKTTERKMECCSVVNNISDDSPIWIPFVDEK